MTGAWPGWYRALQLQSGAARDYFCESTLHLFINFMFLALIHSSFSVFAFYDFIQTVVTLIRASKGYELVCCRAAVFYCEARNCGLALIEDFQN